MWISVRLRRDEIVERWNSGDASGLVEDVVEMVALRNRKYLGRIWFC